MTGLITLRQLVTLFHFLEIIYLLLILLTATITLNHTKKTLAELASIIPLLITLSITPDYWLESTSIDRDRFRDWRHWPHAIECQWCSARPQ